MSRDVLSNSISFFPFPPAVDYVRMSSEFEYRRLATAYLDLAKRTGVLADKTQLLGIADAWLDLADRIGRKSRNSRRRTVDYAEHPLVAETLGNSEGA